MIALSSLDQLGGLKRLNREKIMNARQTSPLETFCPKCAAILQNTSCYICVYIEDEHLTDRKAS